jgi:death on curing protein
VTSSPRYLTVQEILYIHDRMIERYGGRPGVISENLIGSSAGRPRQSAFGQDAYTSLHEKAAALLESLALNHGFVDGNKRVAYGAAVQFLALNGITLSASADDAEAFVLGVAAGEHDTTSITTWIVGHTDA